MKNDETTAERIIAADILAALTELRNREVLYLPNTGNAGDSLIAAATYQVFSRLSIKYKIVNNGTPVEKVTGKVLILGGGGNLIPNYGTIKAAISKFHKVVDKLILLPHTVRGNEDLLQNLGGNCWIFCRDVPSYVHVLSNCDEAKVYLSHDMALHTDPGKILFDIEDLQGAQFAFKEKLESLSIDLSLDKIREEAYYMRQDREAARIYPRYDLDISQAFAFGVNPQAAFKSSWCLLEAIRVVESVKTDRLHVGISSHLLDKKCTLLNNSYGKNFEVWRHSLKKISRCVSFQNSEHKVEAR